MVLTGLLETNHRDDKLVSLPKSGQDFCGCPSTHCKHSVHLSTAEAPQYSIVVVCKCDTVSKLEIVGHGLDVEP
jgi:hypothetical protein